MSERRGATLVAFLGTTAYTPVHYELGRLRALDGEIATFRTKHWQRFVPLALVELLPQAADVRVDRLLVLETEEAARRNGAGLQQALASLAECVGDLPRVDRVQIEDGNREAALWRVFATLGEQLQKSERIVLDLTHGFRSLPAMAVMAAAYLRQAKQVEIEAVLYGAFEAVVPAPEWLETAGAGLRDRPPIARVAAWHDYLATNGRVDDAALKAPIFDLTGMFELTEWAHAVNQWTRTGRASALVDAAKKHTVPIAKALQAGRPKALTELPRELRLLDEALAMVRHDAFAGASKGVRARVEDAAAQIGDGSPLTPLRELLKELPAQLPVTSDSGGATGYFEAQLSTAGWYARHRRMGEALTVLRELFTSLCVYVAGADPTSPSREDRERSEGLVGECVGLWESMRDADRVPEDVRERVRAFFAVDGRKAAWIRLLNSLQSDRNKVNHAWTGEHSRERFNEKAGEGYQQRIFDALDAMKRLVADATGGLSEVPSSPQPKPGVFVNLSKHPIASWSGVQRRGALELVGAGSDEPSIALFDALLPDVDPHADLAAVELEARRCAERAVELGASAAHVAGEFTLVAVLVPMLQARGVRCYAATSIRVVDELSDGDVTTSRRSFRFVAWREYPAVRLETIS